MNTVSLGNTLKSYYISRARLRAYSDPVVPTIPR